MGKKSGASDAAEAQANAQREAMDTYTKMWEQTSQWLSPYREAGIPALQSLQSLSSPGGQQDFLNNYYNSPEFAQMSQQARQQQLAASEATGGLGSTSTGNALASIAPQLGQAALQRQLGLMGNMANIGQSAAAGQASSGMGFAGGLAQMQQGMGQINAGAAGQPSKLEGFLGGAASGAATGATIGGPWGALAGGVIGGVSSLF